MQLTNIARDIIEDAAMGRIYLPLSWLQEAQIPAAEVAAPEYREKLAMLSLRLLREADRYYRSGDAGLWYLSFRSACAVSAARQVYSEIGSLLLRKGARAWDQRIYVTGSLKLWVVIQRCAEFAQVSSRAFVETVVSCALTHRVEVFKCSVN